MTTPLRTLAVAPGLARPESDDSALVTSWVRSLRARNLSNNTLLAYEASGRQLVEHLSSNGAMLAASNKRMVEAWVDSLLSTRSAQTARTRYIAVQQFYKWLVEEGELEKHPMRGMKPPVVPEKNRPVPTIQQVQALLRAAEGKSFMDRRDHAMLSTLVDTGMRAAECLSLSLSDVDLDNQVFYIIGKGRKARPVPFSNESAAAIDRYLRLRRTHKHSAADGLWLGQNGPLTHSGLQGLVDRRAEMAGLPHWHPHLFRHGFAHYWLMNGGQETDLMRLLGWRSNQMLLHYARATAQDRAVEAYRRSGSPLRGI